MKMYHLVEAESLWALSQRGAVNLPQVKELQDKLRAAGHDPGASDGWYGQKTADAVRAYQQANGLKVDGDAGPQTLAKLGMAGAQQTKAVATPPEKTAAKPAPRKTSSEPKTVAPSNSKTVAKTEPKQTKTKSKQTSTRADRSGLPSFDRVERGEPIRTNDDVASRILTLWYDSDIAKNQYRTFISMAIADFAKAGIMRKSAAGLVEMDLEEWGEKAGIVGPDDLPIIQDKQFITTTKSAAGFTFAKIVPKLKPGVNLKSLIRKSRNQLIQDGLLRESAAGLHDMYVQDFIKSSLNR